MPHTVPNLEEEATESRNRSRIDTDAVIARVQKMSDKLVSDSMKLNELVERLAEEQRQERKKEEGELNG